MTTNQFLIIIGVIAVVTVLVNHKRIFGKNGKNGTAPDKDVFPCPPGQHRSPITGKCIDPREPVSCASLLAGINQHKNTISQLNTFIAQGGLPAGVSFPSVPGQSFTTLTEVRDWHQAQLNTKMAQYNAMGCTTDTYGPRVTFTTRPVTPSGPQPDPGGPGDLGGAHH